MKLTPETVVLINFGRNDIQKLARGIRDRGIYTMVKFDAIYGCGSLSACPMHYARSK